MKNVKEKALIELIKEDSYVTSKELAQKLNVSTKTVQNLIKNINFDSGYYGVFVESKRHYGYCLKILDRNRFEEMKTEKKIDLNDDTTLVK